MYVIFSTLLKITFLIFIVIVVRLRKSTLLIMEPLYKQVKNYPDKWYNKTGWVIFWMIFFLPVGAYGLWNSDKLSISEKAGLCVGYLFLLVIALSDNGPKYPTASNNTFEQPALSAPKYDPPTDDLSVNWSYSENQDRMSGVKTRFASIQSDERLKFDFPYNGGTTFTLSLRHSKEGDDVILQCDKCQFIHSYAGDNSIQVKFDQGSPETYSFSDATDGSSDLIFIQSTSRFINKLKKSNHILIGAEFYQSGTRYIDFSVKGLDWNNLRITPSGLNRVKLNQILGVYPVNAIY